MAAGGGETYDPPPRPFVDPGIPGGWELIAASPTVIALVGGFIGNAGGVRACSCSR
jgi:hypothetical protein